MAGHQCAPSLEEPTTSRQLQTRVNINDRHFEQSVEHMLSEIIGDDNSLSDVGSDDTDDDPNYELSDHLSDSEQEMDLNHEQLPYDNPQIEDDHVDQLMDQEDQPIDHVADAIEEEGMNTIPLNEDESRHIDEIISSVINGAGQLRQYLHYYGKATKNKPAFKWRKKQPPTNVRTRNHNIIMKVPTLKDRAKALGDAPTPLQIFELLMTQDMFQEILHWTNLKISQAREKYKRKNLSFIQDMDIVELRALVGLLIYSSVFKANNESVLSFYATDGTGREVFRCTFSKERFLFLISALRFDNPADRQDRAKDDPAAAISKILQRFIDNSQQCYSIGETACVDEMLIAFRGRCRFRMYMPNKPAKYGIKIMAMTDARTQFLYNAYIYSGKDCYGNGLSASEKKLSKPTQSVLRLVKPIEGSRRNVTGDNWFSSIELANELKKRDLTYVGTMKKNKIEIPEEFKPNTDRVVSSSIYGFTDDLTLMSYVPKQKKAVIMISSMHHGQHDDPDTGKPEMIEFYNHTKGGVDGLDFKCANYSSSRRTKRWPMAVFYTIVDVASGVNSFVLYQSFKDSSKKTTRMEFIKDLAASLVQPHMRRRLNKGRLDKDLKFSIRRILGLRDELEPGQHPDVLERKKTCSFCPPKKKRQTRFPCIKCGVPICLECTKKVCVRCIASDDK
ncbi:piggyBac transposable element-derived protein 4-like [Nilaparvata lugens]|uniref:piggyBac transposable element-derived protein 4-like n=1 Tax=Nilaparvata lugens TaxID=108931 RepID=UPI00193D5930|nr:piggyBac transposable element-derived protein 4-like [Nilaparvata lugens]